jgi:hypothetical protein
MNTLTIYLLSIFLLLVAAMLIFRVLVRGDYLHRGYLSVVSSALQALLFFVYGGFPSIYLSGEWPVSHANLVFRIIGLTFVTIGLAILLRLLTDSKEVKDSATSGKIQPC